MYRRRREGAARAFGSARSRAVPPRSFRDPPPLDERSAREALPFPGGASFARPCSLDDDPALHMRMKRAEIRIGARGGEGVGEAVAGIERVRLELALVGRDRVRDVILVGPYDGRA